MRGSRRPCAFYSRCVESTSLTTRKYLREGRPGTIPPDSGEAPGRGLIVSAALDAPLSARSRGGRQPGGGSRGRSGWSVLLENISA
ncbi:hypothetical protein E2C01_028635 [Portunus trituberculatus]|uniref:Uncharacterized protein n=1 Tax=Portunus trituberculatus TaxID=210409 RepID=A0A5B7EPJ3_PORTR|nr:hypothetical protein [Portunus trituberculatus]